MKQTTTQSIQTSARLKLKDINAEFLEMEIERQRRISSEYKISLMKKFISKIGRLWKNYVEANKVFVKAHYISDNNIHTYR